ncbi:MAG: glycosyltransferase family 4 protein [Desulfurococcaceae archaeon]
MKAYIVDLFTVCGGGERVSLEMASVLRERGFSVTFVTSSEDALRKCAEMFQLPGNYEVIEVKSFLEGILRITGRFIRYRRLLLISKAYEKLLSSNTDGLIIDSGIDIPLATDISYIHYPAGLSTTKSSSLHWRLYNWLVTRKVRSIMGDPKLVLTNSSWTAKLIRETYGLSAEILYPPVDVDYYAYDGGVKEKIIVTVSRIIPEKNLHLLPRVASKLPDYEWYLVGSTGRTKLEKHFSGKLLIAIENEKKKNQASNFYVLTDVPRGELRELLQRAMFYVHPLFPEHFGIAVVEAMSAGAVPIVYRDGGAWTNVVSDVSHELGYVELDEVPAIIRDLENNPRKLAELREKAVRKSMMYRRGVFREKFAGILEKLLSQQ